MKNSKSLYTQRAAPVTIRDIAAELGIAHSTVSRALGEHPHINAETRALVRATAQRMRYLPNASARIMRNARSTLIGLMIPDIQNDFYATAAKIIANTLAARNFQLVLSVTEDDPDRELRELRALRGAQAAGVIIVPSPVPNPDTLDLLSDFTSLQLLRKVASPEMPTVLMDDRAGTRAATRHLINYGHRKIGYIGGNLDMSTGRERLAGFEDTMAQQGLSSSHIALGLPRPDFARQIVTSWMTQLDCPTALVLGSSELTLGALKGLRAAGRRWPHDVSIVGHGDPAWFELADGGITTISLPVSELALAAANMMLDALAEPGRPHTQSERDVSTFSPSLTVRGSTAPLQSG